MPFQSIPRRTFLRGIAGAALAVPTLEAMLSRRALAGVKEGPGNFVALFLPNGTSPEHWNPPPGPLNAGTVSECLQDLGGYGPEGIWPSTDSVFDDVTVVRGIDHSGVMPEIHSPARSLFAHGTPANTGVSTEPTLDQYLADRIGGSTPFRTLPLCATNAQPVGQAYISFRDGQQVANHRDPVALFETLFAQLDTEDPQVQAARARKLSVLDLVREDAQRLQARVGQADAQRLDQYFESIFDLEKQLTANVGGCASPEDIDLGILDSEDPSADNHGIAKLFVDMTVLALACELTKVITLHYGNSWGLNYRDFPSLGTGGSDPLEAIGNWSDHQVSHRLGFDGAGDLGNVDNDRAVKVANARVITTSRFKARRFSNLVNALRAFETPTGTLLEQSLVLFTSEIGNGASHSRKNMPVMLAGGVGGFQTGRVVQAQDQPTGALHASIIKKFGIDVDSYGSPAGSPIDGL